MKLIYSSHSYNAISLYRFGFIELLLPMFLE